MTAATYLRSKEWTMGSGQCWECCGLGPWRFQDEAPYEKGHTEDCAFADSLEELGEWVLRVGQLHGPKYTSPGMLRFENELREIVLSALREQNENEKEVADG